MLRKFIFIIVSFSIICCQSTVQKDFGTVAKNFVSDYTKLFPDEAPLSIDAQNLDKWVLLTPSYMDSIVQFEKRYRTVLSDIDIKNIPKVRQEDYQKMQRILKNIHAYSIDYTHNPQRYNVLYAIKRIIESDYASDEYRLKIALSRVKQVPVFYENAKQQLHDVDPKSADAAVEQHLQTYLFIAEVLPNYVKSRRLMTPLYSRDLEAAALAVKDYVAFVESFRLK